MATPNPEFEREQFLNKPLPSSAESERALLGAVLLDNQLFTQAAEVLTPEDFYSPLHRRVFKAMTALFEASQRIDPILIGEELKKDGSIDSLGGVATITNLTYGLPHFSDIQDYVRIVKEKSITRNLIKVCNQITAEALAEEEDAEVILDHAEQMIFALADEKTRQGFAHVRPVAEDVLAKVQEFAKRDSHALTGLATGFRDLDEMTSGLQRSDLIIIAARPSMGKCLSANAEIVEDNGNISTIEEICKRRNARLLTLKENFKFKLTEANDFIDDGIKPVFRIETRLGRQIETTLTHPFLTINGWEKLEKIRVGQKIAVPRILDIFGKEDRRECEVKILAYLLGDGCLTKTCPEFTSENERIQEDFRLSVAEFGGVEAVQSNTKDRAFSFRIRKSKDTKDKKNPLRLWLEKMEIYGCNSHRKFIPKEIFTLNRELIALFLNRLFSTDGWASVLSTGQPQLGFCSVSEKMIRQIQHLLLRFGIIGKLKKRSVRYNNTRKSAWQIDITDALSIKIFAAEIGIFGKEEALNKTVKTIENRNYQTNKDLIPVEIWESIAECKKDESWLSLARRAGIKGYTNLRVGKRALSRKRLQTLANALEDKFLQNLADSEIYWDEIVSIEFAGNKQVYDLTIPETHNFVANDICVHNTALCLTLAQNAAIIEKAVVAVFSLEMSKEQLVMRMLSSEAKVDAHRFRTGHLIRDEWGRLAEAIGTLSEARIFVDDTPGISVLQMRAKARRLAAEQKQLDLIVIDYMQLMSGSGRTESRQQEVSKISRELKGLAKELNVPVIALSQLSRAPEARNPPKPMLSDLRESGCLAGESLITLADSGERVPIKNLVGKKGFRVWSLNQKTWKLEKGIVTNAFATGVKPVYKLKTRLGRTIRATVNHKFYSFKGWKRLDELQIGERLALPREIINQIEQTMSSEELALLAHLIGDGCTLPKHSIQYTTRELDLAETVTGLGNKVFGSAVGEYKKQSLSEIENYLDGRTANTNRDIIPSQLWNQFAHEKIESSNLNKKLFRIACGSNFSSVKTRNFSRERLERIALAINSKELRLISQSEIYWDEIVSIEPDGETEVYDLTVKDLANFESNGLIVHNSIEQDADVVAFIYREEYYKPEEENAGVAELLISKQRNGPVGSVKLAFLKEFTRFENYFGG